MTDQSLRDATGGKEGGKEGAKQDDRQNSKQDAANAGANVDANASTTPPADPSAPLASGKPAGTRLTRWARATGPFAMSVASNIARWLRCSAAR